MTVIQQILTSSKLVSTQRIKCRELLRNRQLLGAMSTGTQAYWLYAGVKHARATTQMAVYKQFPT
ncbi:hypothetical protein MAMMFC1_03031 [Methylomusa anaerophila]|uniref:Uncharacterized protein n=1 Tax=Methylomusa anaerophila TaxID=1930071 RepID=A0A348AMP0_9FIRM|nr:hypothetical protein MAMMFC1_03031 [Methylomusa anaerophila]